MDLSTFPDALGTLVLDSDTFGVISVRFYFSQMIQRGGFVEPNWLQCGRH
jgi:hypothetical protein